MSSTTFDYEPKISKNPIIAQYKPIFPKSTYLTKLFIFKITKKFEFIP